ncbi:(deoxy)nucleoside triphosphate pyrophosphohydrolase [Qipengyuania sp. RS5-5]|uniref:8-oxo-dGTP diphosphatase n=1 Tax=Parerythrobacter lacustris TaxID=2969984 RepID=A0ABT1XQY1_9SPHN|nr:(deoxy)nucleoside triphosphate pyrophosphohydrolase [Parerythrobacter lacustris]
MPVVALALRASNGRVLMHRRPFEKAHGGLWEFPGGKVEAGEHPVIALVREISEELAVGIDPSHLEPVGFAQTTVDGAAPPIVILLYACTAWTGELTSQEGGAIGWFDEAEVKALDKPPLDIMLADQLFAKSPR